MTGSTRSAGKSKFTWREIVPITAGVLLLAGFIYWATRPSLLSLLDIDSPTPAQIRQIASNLLLHEDFNVRTRASAKLQSLGQTAVPVLADLARTHADANLRRVVLELLLVMDPKAAADVMAQLSQDQSPEVQLAAVAAAKQIDDPRSFDILNRGAQSSNEVTRLAAVEALGARREERAVPALEAALRDPNASITVQRHAARSLQLITGRDYNGEIRQR